MKKVLILLLSILTLTGSAQSFKKQKVKRERADGSTEKFKLWRDMSVYPDNPAGRDAFFVAVNSGCTAFSYTHGGTIPVSGTCVSAPSWITGMRYSYTGGLLTMEGAGQIGRLKFERQDNQAFTTTNPDGVTINSNTFYVYGPLNNQAPYDRQWAVNLPQVPLRITAEQAGGSATYAYTFTPSTGAQRIVLSGSNTSPPTCTTCGTGTTTGPSWLAARYTQSSQYLQVQGDPSDDGNGITLRIERVDGVAMALQNDNNPSLSSGVDYPWGQLNNQAPFVIEWTLGPVPTVPIRLTFKKPGQADFVHVFTPALTATPVPLFTAAGSSGGGTTTPPACTTCGSGTFAYQAPAQPSDWTEVSTEIVPPYNIPVKGILRQESGNLRIELAEGFGATLQIQRKVGTQWVSTINRRDQGRCESYCGYAGPLNYAADQGNFWAQIGYNPLGGGVSGEAGPVLVKGITPDGWLYAKTQYVSWPHNQLQLLPIYVERWAKVTNKRVDVRLKVTHFRGDKTLYDAREQETPFTMIWPATEARFYNGNQPFTNASTTSTDAVGWTISSFPLSEPWIAANLPEGGYIGLVSPDLYNANLNYTNLGGESGEYSDRFMYMGARPYSHLDADQTFYHEYSYVIGSEADIREAAYALPRQALPSWTFSRAAGRAGWVGLDGISDKGEPFNSDYWNPKFEGKTELIGGVPTTHASTVTLQSPAGAWKAADFTTLYIRMKYAKGASNAPNRLRVTWLRVGQKPSGFDPNNAGNSVQYPLGQRDDAAQTVYFDVQDDGQFHTYAVNLASAPGWTGIIHRFEIGNDRGCCGLIQKGQQLEIQYIGATNLDTAPERLCPSCTYPAYAKVLFVGNSITYHPYLPGVWEYAWAMAASAPDKTFMAQVVRELKTVNTNLQARTLVDFEGDGGSVTGSTGSDWEQNHRTFNLDRFNNVAAWGANLIVVHLAENIADLTNLSADYKALLAKLRSGNPSARVVLTNSIWNQAAVTSVINGVASELGLSLVDVADFWSNPGYYVDQTGNGVQRHPNDAGHRELARRTLVAIASTPSAPVCTTCNSGTATTAGFEGYGGIYAANSSYTAQPETARPSASPWRSFIDNGVIKAGINVRVGSVLDWLSVAGSNLNLINSPVWNSGREDAGRQVMDAMYGFPNGVALHPWSEGLYSEAGLSSFSPVGIGYNPVQGGNIDDYPKYGETLIHSVQNGLMYSKTQPVQWELRPSPRGDGTGVLGKMYMETWQQFDPAEPRAVRRHSRWTMFRDDPQASHYPTPRQQELPCAYVHPSYSEFWYCAGKPYTNASLVPYPITSSGAAEPPRFSTEPFILAKNPGTGRVIILYTPHSGRVVAAEHPNGPNATFPAAYIASAPMLSCDRDGVYDFDVALGEFPSEAAARIWLYNQPRWPGTFEVRFDQGKKSRFGCTLYNAYDQLEKNIVDGITVTPATDNENGGRDFDITLPERWINADVHKHVYLRASFQGSNSIYLRWKKGAQEFTHPLSINADGQLRTIDIDLTNVPNWSGDLGMEVSIKRGNYGSGLIPLQNDQWHIKWISYRNLDNQ
ncbi:SGNH/GDSL hydrolase family protein [Spirosoma sordidisoli]|uniref:SGNH/GDSL hydrolase family protein n=1 Tax=Spirosoma sordidisoli TaxID=2502893 RepID=A0A4Q2UKK1_9BACT|nr:SGNH/GDSL hydrolase family protein [Spirosoma sordidisoli]RYC69824.1 SGNH/GDSL hydrolase family protein [Spirosoma sordidisoli]